MKKSRNVNIQLKLSYFCNVKVSHPPAPDFHLSFLLIRQLSPLIGMVQQPVEYSRSDYRVPQPLIPIGEVVMIIGLH